jgi:hypothetical protein
MDPTSFFSAVSTQGYCSRAVPLWNKYAVLIAPLNVMEDHIGKLNCIPFTEVQSRKLLQINRGEVYVEASSAEPQLRMNIKPESLKSSKKPS